MASRHTTAGQLNLPAASSGNLPCMEFYLITDSFSIAVQWFCLTIQKESIVQTIINSKFIRLPTRMEFLIEALQVNGLSLNPCLHIICLSDAQLIALFHSFASPLRLAFS